ncbi:hypothetical protein, partial [Cetobacterium sp.]|uniref:hypothetical protein n=1 Tax=Cetobacterium sp. TaxID=2071632 RepID=UPI003EE6CE09
TGTLNSNIVNVTNLNANNITSGKIDTSKLNISSLSGNLSIQDNTIQITDNQTTPKVRVQIGEDAQGDYNMYVYNPGGKLVFDAIYGVTEDGISNNAVGGDKIKDTSITSNKLVIEEIWANSAWIGEVQTVSLSAEQITTGKISGERIDISGIVSFEALNPDMKNNFIFDTTGNKTFIDGGQIYTNTVTAEKINAKGLTVLDENNNTTFNIDSKGEVFVTGTIQSSNFSEDKQEGYKISKSGDIIMNNAIIRGDVLLPNAGITNYSGEVLPPEQVEEIIIDPLSYKIIDNDLKLLYTSSSEISEVSISISGKEISSTNITSTEIIFENSNFVVGTQTINKLTATFTNSKKAAFNKEIVVVKEAVVEEVITKFTVVPVEYSVTTQDLVLTFKVPKDKIVDNILMYYNGGWLYADSVTQTTATFGASKIVDGTQVVTTIDCRYENSDYDRFSEKVTIKKNVSYKQLKVLRNNREVRFWAGTDFKNRHKAPFKVLQDGSFMATKGEIGGTFTGELHIGNIHITDTNSTEANFEIKTNKDAETVVKLTDKLSFIDSSFIFGNSDNRIISFDKPNKKLSFNNSAISMIGRNNKTININQENDLISVANGSVNHSIKYKENTLEFNSTSTANDFTFTNSSNNVTVNVKGEVNVDNIIRLGEMKIAKRTDAENGGVDFIL